MAVYRQGGVFGDCLHQLIQAGCTHRADILEVLEQRRLAGRAYPLDAIQGGVAQMAGLLLSVELDGKAVGLLLDAPDEGENRLVLLDTCLLYTSRCV